MRGLRVILRRYIEWGRSHPIDGLAVFQLGILGMGLLVKEQFLGIASWVVMAGIWGIRWGIHRMGWRVGGSSGIWSLSPIQWDWVLRGVVVTPILVSGFLIPYIPYVGVSGFRDTRDLVVVVGAILISLYLMAIEWDQFHKWSHPMMAIALYGIASLGWWALGTDFLLYGIMIVVMGIWGMSWVGPISNRESWVVKPLYLTIPLVAIVACRMGSTHVISGLFPTGLMIQYFFSIPGLILGGFLSMLLVTYPFGWWQWVLVPVLPLLLGVILGPEAGLMSWVSFGYLAPVVGLRDIGSLSRLGLLGYGMSVVSVIGFPATQYWLSALSGDMRSILGIGMIVGWLMVILLSNQIRYEWSLDSVIRARLRRKKRK